MQITAGEDTGDARMHLEWHSPSRSREGVSYYETRGARFFIPNWTVAADLVDVYLPVWERVLSTYLSPDRLCRLKRICS